MRFNRIAEQSGAESAAARWLDRPSFFSLTIVLDGPTGVKSMKAITRNLIGTAIVVVFGLAALPAFSQTPTPTPSTAPLFRPAPGPIAGASLPILAVGFGVYWLVRRNRRKAE